MQNRVGSTIPSEQEVSKLVKDVEAVAEKIAKFAIDLNADERMRVVKMRRDADGVIEIVGKLLNDHGIVLPGIDADEMRADFTLARRIQPLRNALASALQTIDDTILEAESECWHTATAAYTALARTSSNDAKLAADLKPVVDFFRVGKRRKAEELNS